MDDELKQEVIKYLRKLALDIENGDKDLCGFRAEMSRDPEKVFCEASGFFENRPTMERPIVNGVEISGSLPPFIRELRDAIREDRKNHTRRVMKPQPECRDLFSYADKKRHLYFDDYGPGAMESLCPYGQPGEIRALREPLVNIGGYACYADDDPPITVHRQMDNHVIPWRWKVNTLSQLYMPYEAARTFALIKDIRIERIQDITDEDAKAEGLTYLPNSKRWGTWDKNRRMENHFDNPIDAFRFLWDSINAKRGFPWEQNDWVWVVEFERIKDEN